MGEREKWNGSCAVERGRMDEVKAVKSRMKWVDCLPPGAMVTSRSGLLPRAMPRSVILLQSVSVLEVSGPFCHQRPHKCPGSGL